MFDETFHNSNILSIKDEEDAKRFHLLDRIRQHESMKKQQGVKIVLRKGIPTPSLEEIQALNQRRIMHLNMITLQRHIENTERRKEEWKEYISYEPQSHVLDHISNTKVETTSLEGRSVILSPLLSLFRMLICNNRAKDRLQKLRTRQSLLVPDTPPIHTENQTIIELISVAQEHLAVKPVHINSLATVSNLFMMPGSFDIKPLRNPFVFLSRQYQMERLPEFNLDLTKAATEEYAAYTKLDYNEPSAVTLSEFVQPLVLLETYDVPKRAYEAVYKRNNIVAYELFGSTPQFSQFFSVKDKNKDVNINNIITNDIGLSQELSHLGLPLKLAGPQPEDSLSESDGEDAPNTFQTDISWLPNVCNQKKNDVGEILGQEDVT